MPRTHIRHVKISKWFPPNDKFAACVARLSILREDFLLELAGIEAEVISDLDQGFPEYRRIYFFRNSIRTIFEIVSAMTMLQQQPEFKRILAQQSPADQTEFRNLVREFNAKHALVKKIRNSIGGHVLQSSIEGALNGCDSDRASFLEVGEKRRNVRYRFAGEILVAILVAGIPDDEQASKSEEELKSLAELLPALSVVDKIVEMYLDARGLL